jgi:hypothetical protein
MSVPVIINPINLPPIPPEIVSVVSSDRWHLHWYQTRFIISSSPALIRKIAGDGVRSSSF